MSVERYRMLRDLIVDCYCEMDVSPTGDYVQFEDYQAIQSQLAEKDAIINQDILALEKAMVQLAEAREAWQIRNNDACRLEQEIEAHAWEISPAMAQAKIDELNRQIAELKSVLAEIANQDYRGNRSTQSTIAYNALMKIAKEASNG